MYLFNLHTLFKTQFHIVSSICDIRAGSRKVTTKYHYCDWIQYLKRTFRGEQHNINANETSIFFVLVFPWAKIYSEMSVESSIALRSDQWVSSSHNQKCNQILIIVQCK